MGGGVAGVGRDGSSGALVLMAASDEASQHQQPASHQVPHTAMGCEAEKGKIKVLWKH